MLHSVPAPLSPCSHSVPAPLSPCSTQSLLNQGVEQGVVLSCRFAESKVRWTSRVLWMSVVSQSSVKSSRRKSASSSVGANQLKKIIEEVATTTSYCCAQRGLATSWFGGESVVNDRGVLYVCSHHPGATLTHAAIWCSRGVCRAGNGTSL